MEWLETGGPVRTLRDPVASLPVAERTPWGGYDIGVLANEEAIDAVERFRHDPRNP